MTLCDRFLQTSDTLLAWKGPIKNQELTAVARQYQNYLDTIAEQAPINAAIKHGAQPLVDKEIQGQQALNTAIEKAQRYFHFALGHFNHLTVDGKGPHAYHLLHETEDESSRSIALEGIAAILECPYRLWIGEGKRSLKHTLNNGLYKLIGWKKSPRENIAFNQRLFYNNILSCQKKWIALTQPEDKIQWLTNKITLFVPILKKLEQRIDALEKEGKEEASFEAQELHQAFSTIQGHLEELKKTVEEKQATLRENQERIRLAQRNAALILFQRYVACQWKYQANHSPEDHQALLLIKNELHKLLGIDELWPWQKLWHWLTFHGLYGFGGRYFQQLRQLRKTLHTGGHFTLIAQLMLKKDFICTEYSRHVFYTQQSLYGTGLLSQSILAYHSYLLANQKNRQEVLKQTEKVIGLFNATPHIEFKKIQDAAGHIQKITLAPLLPSAEDKDASSVTIDDPTLIQCVTALTHAKEEEAGEHFQQILRTFKRGLENTWSTFFTQSMVVYNGLSLRKLIHFFTRTKQWDINHPVHKLISFLRAQGCRLDAHRFYETLQALEADKDMSNEEKMEAFLSAVKNIFEQFRLIDYSQDRTTPARYGRYRIFKLLFMNRSVLLADTAMDERLRDPLMHIVNDIFEHYGHHETIKKTTLQGKNHYHFVPVAVTNDTMKERLGTRWWIPVADAISLFNALGSAFFAGFAFFLTGQLLWGCIILTAAFFANILLFITAQRETFIELFIKDDLWHNVSFPKKIVIGLVFFLCLTSCLFEGYLIAVSSATALAHLAFLPAFVTMGFSALVGVIMGLGMFALFFYMSITLIKNDFHLAILHFIRDHLLFKGFLDKSPAEQCIYLLTWILNVLLLPLAIVGALIYTMAYLGLGYDQMVKGLQKIPHISYAAVTTLVGIFIGIAFIMEAAFAEKNFIRLGNLLAALPGKIINHLKGKNHKMLVGVERSMALGLEEKPDDPMTLAKHSAPEIENAEMAIAKGIKDPNDFLPIHPQQNSIPLKDTFWNTPERCLTPFASGALYILVLGFLIPINAIGNAKSTAEGAPTLVELLHRAGLHQLSEWIVDKVVLLTCFVGSLGVCGLASHDELSKGIPSSEAHPELDVLVKRYRRFAEPEKKPYVYSDHCKAKAITHFFSKENIEPPLSPPPSSRDLAGSREKVKTPPKLCV